MEVYYSLWGEWGVNPVSAAARSRIRSVEVTVANKLHKEERIAALLSQTGKDGIQWLQ